MYTKKLYKDHFKKHWPEYLFLILLGVLYGISQVDISIDWIGNKDVWLNTILSTIMIYYGMSFFTRKIDNQYIRELIGLILALIIGQIFVFSIDPMKVGNKLTWILIVSSILFFLGMGIQGLSMGFRKVQKMHKDNLESIENMSIKLILDSIKELNKAIDFVKKHPDSAYWITSKEKIDTAISLLKQLKTHPKYIKYINNQKIK